ncbi:hypothetical protein MRB53_006117 [Persea americana]|uniref:Uncharacterized protein n=1 Tax=Persea americana TaxID=3435 RepID=A0ACC2MG98_PERAE|nr:hypothetical protein MRB53_006117 [Persea americana]
MLRRETKQRMAARKSEEGRWREMERWAYVKMDMRVVMDGGEMGAWEEDDGGRWVLRGGAVSMLRRETKQRMARRKSEEGRWREMERWAYVKMDMRVVMDGGEMGAWEEDDGGRWVLSLGDEREERQREMAMGNLKAMGSYGRGWRWAGGIKEMGCGMKEMGDSEPETEDDRSRSGVHRFSPEKTEVPGLPSSLGFLICSACRHRN